MTRSIYVFYCYNCHHWQKSRSPMPYIQADNQIISILCSTCQKQVPLNKTNLLQERYKIDFERQWYIIDQDSKIPHIIFLSDSKSIATDVCRQLNNGVPISAFQDSLLAINDAFKHFSYKFRN